MKKALVAALLALLCTMTAGAQGTEERASLKKVYDETINPMEQIDQAVAQAKSEGKFVICQVGGNWCIWCLRFADYISRDAEISKLIDENFVYVHVNYHPRKSGDAGKAMLRRLGGAGRFGYPVFVVLDGDGNVLHQQDSAYLEDGGTSYDRKKVLSFFNHWTPNAVNQ